MHSIAEEVLLNEERTTEVQKRRILEARKHAEASSRKRAEKQARKSGQKKKRRPDEEEESDEDDDMAEEDDLDKLNAELDRVMSTFNNLKDDDSPENGTADAGKQENVNAGQKNERVGRKSSDKKRTNFDRFYTRSRMAIRKLIKTQTFFWVVIAAVFLNSLCIAIQHSPQPKYLDSFLCECFL